MKAIFAFYIKRTTRSHGGVARGCETGVILTILEMVKDEVEASTGENNESEADYEKSRGTLRETLDAQTASKVADEQELAELQEDIADTKEIEDSTASDLPEQQVLEASLEKDCAWVENHFNSRREKRKRD